MTYPSGQPEQGGQGHGAPQQSPGDAGAAAGPYATPSAPGPAAGQPNPYATPAAPAGPGSYGGRPPYPPQPPYGPPGGSSYGPPPYGPPQFAAPHPPPPGGGGAGKRRLAVIAGCVVAAVVLVGGGVYLATRGGADPDKPVADRSPSASVSASRSSGPSGPSGSPSGGFTDDPTDGPSNGPGEPAPAKGFTGQWQDSGGRTLTVGSKYTSGKAKGDYSVNLIDPGGDGILIGLGRDRGDGAFRIALKPMGSDKGGDVKAATLTRSGSSAIVAWDKGGRLTLKWIG
ncbi:hypothetical protein AB0C59_00760 [Streptomyces sp. NPDC048664]|uniref:hypothetical protein n=1 Tax=Streptomyces sp. NPDC048664 TaxID=3154505 RepID=UPI00343C93DC